MTNPNYEPPAAKNPIDTRRKFKDEEVWHLRRRYKMGAKISNLAKENNVSHPCMAAVIRGTGTYKDV